MPKKLRIKTTNSSSIVIRRNVTKSEKLVYIACGNRKFKYQYGKSKIVYIGTTKTGANRIAQSAANKAKSLFDLHGLKELEFYIVTCGIMQNVKTWKKFERALILTFRQVYGEPPKSNTQGKRIKWTDEKKYFTISKLESVLEKYS